MPEWRLRSQLLLRHPLTDKSIAALAQDLLRAVSVLRDRARDLYYAVMLSGHACLGCGGALIMLREGCCQCQTCSQLFDPTVAFQTCGACGGRLRLHARRYTCRRCGTTARSVFLFDGMVFDAAYFRQKMAESRTRQRARRARVRKMLAESRSPPIEVSPADADGLAALQTALDALTASLGAAPCVPPRSDFDLPRYERHVAAQCGQAAIALADIAPLIADPRRDLIYRFIALIFLAHAGVVRVWQDGRDILVIHREADHEGQGLP